MAWDEEDDSTIYTVVVNHEEQYSIWTERRGAIPRGWKAVGKQGKKQACLDYIEEVWTDMRPLNLRKRLQESQAQIRKDAGR